MVLMSATLGDVSFFVRDLRERTGREVAVVDDAVRPVPLEMEYAVEPIGELLQRLVGQGRAPVYVVHFSQRAAVERASSLLSVDLVPKARRAEVAAALGGFRSGRKDALLSECESADRSACEVFTAAGGFIGTGIINRKSKRGALPQRCQRAPAEERISRIRSRSVKTPQ